MPPVRASSSHYLGPAEDFGFGPTTAFCAAKRNSRFAVGRVGHSGYGAQFKEAELCSRHLGRWVRIGNWCPASGHASFGFGEGCLDGGRERQPGFHVMDLGDCIGERHPWRKAE